MNEVLKRLGDIGLIPVIKLETPEQALPLGRALSAGKLPVAEVTFRTNAAEKSIKILSEELPDLIVGAGTVLTIEQASAAVAAGAKYIVTPGFNPLVVQHCMAKGVPVMPGISSPSEIEQALEMGLEVVKFFPAEQAGGVPMLKAFAGPYGNRISFVPTGGVNAGNLVDYLSCSNVRAVGGSWMVASSLINEGKYDRIAELCAEARSAALGFRLLHVGLNPGGGISEPDAVREAELLASMLGMPAKEGNSSVFVGSGFEIMKSNGRGEKGHIGIETISVERALAWFEDFGVKPVDDTIVKKSSRIVMAYLDKPFMGFALHLNKKA